MTLESPPYLEAVHDVSFAFADISTEFDASPARYKPQTQKPSRRLTQSQKQKREKEALQRQIAQLLQTLKSGRARRKQLSIIGDQDQAVERHLLRRLRSEDQRQWLQAAVAGRAAFIDDLLRIVHQYAHTVNVVSSQSQGLYDGLFLQPTDELLHAMSIYELDRVYQQTDAVFQDSSEDTVQGHPEAVAERGTAVTQYRWKKHFPFSFERTRDSMWLLARLVNRHEQRETYEEVEDPDNTIAVKLRVTSAESEGERASVVHRFVHRRFMRDDGMVFVWRASIIGDGAFRGMQMDETGWGMVRPSASGEGTFSQVCFRQVPLHLNSAQAPPAPLAEQFENFVLTMSRENMQEVESVAENMLLDDALKGLHWKVSM